MPKKSGLTYIDFIRNINAGKLQNVYFVCAADNFFINKASQQLRDKILGKDGAVTNYFVKYGDESKYGEILDLCNNFSSFFSEKKVVVVKRCEKFSRTLDHLFAYSETPDENTYVLFAFDKEYADEKKLTEKYTFYDFSEMPKEFYFQWIKEEFRNRDCKISDTDVLFFADYVPLIFDIMEQEIEKICRYFNDGEDRTVTKELILKMSGFDKAYSPDDLIKAIAEKDKKKALDIIEYLTGKAGVNEVYLLSIITRYLTDLMTFKSPGMMNKSRGELYKLRMWGDSIEFAKKYNTHFELKQLAEAFKILINADKKLKTSQADKGVLMNTVVQELTNL